MGWPNQDPEGWDMVCRGAVAEWLNSEFDTFWSFQSLHRPLAMVEMLQAEHSDIFNALLLKVPRVILHAHEADYLRYER